MSAATEERRHACRRIYLYMYGSFTHTHTQREREKNEMAVRCLSLSRAGGHAHERIRGREDKECTQRNERRLGQRYHQREKSLKTPAECGHYIYTDNEKEREMRCKCRGNRIRFVLHETQHSLSSDTTFIFSD